MGVGAVKPLPLEEYTHHAARGYRHAEAIWTPTRPLSRFLKLYSLPAWWTLIPDARVRKAWLAGFAERYAGLTTQHERQAHVNEEAA